MPSNPRVMVDISDNLASSATAAPLSEDLAETKRVSSFVVLSQAKFVCQEGLFRRGCGQGFIKHLFGECLVVPRPRIKVHRSRAGLRCRKAALLHAMLSPQATARQTVVYPGILIVFFN